MNDHELDKLFRKAAEGFQPDDRLKEKVWKALEGKRNSITASASGRKNNRKWLLLLLFLLGAVAGFYVWDQSDQPIAEQHKDLSAASNKINPSYPPKSQIDQPVLNPKTDAKTIDHSSTNKIITGSAMQKIKAAIAGSVMNNNKQQTNNSSTTLSITDKNNLSFRPIPSNIGKKLPQISMSQTAVLSYPPGFGQQINRIKYPSVDKRSDNEVKENKADSINHSHNKSQWYMGFVFGPDWSGLTGNRWRTGMGGGIRIGYQFHPKWRVTTGILLSKKLYDARPEDYHPDDDIWMNYDITSIHANCLVIDVPLNISYKIWSRENNHITISAGLSSFWMNEEKYIYHFKTSSGVYKSLEKDLYNKNRHIFSVLNISPAYEKSFKHFTIGAAPYVKIPLNNIGFGNVKLYSTGIHFTFQYKLK